MINLFLFFLAPISALKSFVLSDCNEHLFWKRSGLSNPTHNQRPHKLLTTNREEETHLSQSSLIRMTKKGHLLHGTSQLPQIVNKKRLLYEQGNLFFLPAGLLCSSTKELQYFHRDVNDQNSCPLVLTPESEHVPLLPSSILCSIAPKIHHKLHFIESTLDVRRCIVFFPFLCRVLLLWSSLPLMTLRLTPKTPGTLTTSFDEMMIHSFCTGMDSRHGNLRITTMRHGIKATSDSSCTFGAATTNGSAACGVPTVSIPHRTLP